MSYSPETAPRRRRVGRCVQIWFSEDQLEAVQEAARRKGIPVATYLKVSALELVGWEPKAALPTDPEEDF